LPASLDAEAQSAIATDASQDPSKAASDAEADKTTTTTNASAATSTRGGRGRGGGLSGQYLNRERVKTGGPQRKPLTEDELTAKLEKARLQNAAILARREQVEADKSQYEQLTAKEREERAEQARKKLAEKKAQAEQEEERAKARARKLEKQDVRSWDSEKQDDQLWQANYRPYATGGDSGPGSRGRGRGGARGGGSGAGRGGSRGGSAGSGPGRTNNTGRKSEVNISDAAEFPALGKGSAPSAPKAAAKTSEPATTKAEKS